MQIKARLLRCSNGTNHSADEYWRCFPNGSKPESSAPPLVSTLGSTLPSGDLFIIAHAAVLASKLSDKRRVALQRLAMQKRVTR